MSSTGAFSVPRVVIVGGGFGGLSAARALRRVPVSATLVDRRNHHLFQPLLYQVATATLPPADIAAPIRLILRRSHATEVLMSEVTGFDLGGRQVQVAGWFAWLAWLFVHIFFLIGFRNRLLVMVQWAWSYLTWQRGARLITGEVGSELAPPGKPLGTVDRARRPLSEGRPAARDATQAEARGQVAPADAEGTGWMGGDRAPGSSPPAG